MRSLIGIVVLGYFLALAAACSPSAETAVEATQQPVPVRILHIKTQELPLIVEAVGRLASDREVTVAAEIAGLVKTYHADVGDQVRKGQVLVEIDDTDYRLALKEAEANREIAESRLNLSRKVYERAKTLLPRKVITPDDFDKAEAEYVSAAASMSRVKVLVDIAEERLAKTRIRCPFSGLVAERKIEIGQMVGSGRPVMTVVDLMPMRAVIYLSEKEYVQLDKQDPVTVMVEPYPDRKMKGRIDRIGIRADDRTNTFGVEILLDNPHFLLKTGMTARVWIVAQVIHDAVLIPQSTVLYKKDRKEVFVVGKQQRAEVRRVTLGRSLGDRIQILSGLSPGDQLIVSGGQYLKPDDKVLITAFGQAPGQ